MYELPYIIVSSDILIPHPGLEYTITITTEPELFKTGSVTFLNKALLDVFLIILLNDNNKHSKLSALSKIIAKNTSNNELTLSFSVLSKVEIFSKNKHQAKFISIDNEKTEFCQKQLELIKKDIRNNPAFKYISFEIQEYEFQSAYILEKILSFLLPTVKQDYEFFNLKVFSKKLSLLKTLLKSYEKDFSSYKPLGKYTPPTIADIIVSQKERLNLIPNTSSEHITTLDYIQLLEKLPYNSPEIQPYDYSKLKDTLNKNHYGLDLVKQTLIEHIAYQEFIQAHKGTAILFNGPPGTGKTTIAKSLAKALNREYIHISLGGVSDETEIRGHRKSYVGSRPGRILSELKKLNYNNPIILLDEIDKVVESNKGNLFSALLEVLDFNQNDNFTDRFMDTPYDLSKVVFICTSNSKEHLPLPLLDRLEVIEFTSYTTEEKTYILNNYIIPKELTKANILSSDLIIQQDLLHYITATYDLRQISRIIVKIIKKICFYLLTNESIPNIDLEFYKKSFYTQEKKKKRIGF